MNKNTTQNLGKNNTYKFGDNLATVYSGKLKKTFFKNFDFLNSVLMFFIIFISFNIINSISVEFKLNKQTKILNSELYIVKKEQEGLKKQIGFYKSPPGVEKLARERLGMIKEDEVPVRYIDNK